MVGFERIEKLISREKKIFKFLVFYLLLAIFLAFLFVGSEGWAFVETAIIVLVMEIGITGLISRGRPLDTSLDVQRELENIKEINEYTQLRKEYMENKDNTITIALTVYSIGAVVLLFYKSFTMFYISLFIVGLLALYFSVYLFFRYKIDKVTIILLQRRKVVREMKKEKKKKAKKLKKRRERRKLKKLREMALLKRKKSKPTKKKPKKKPRKKTRPKKKKPKKKPRKK